MSDIHNDVPADDPAADPAHDLLHDLIGLVDPAADAPAPPELGGLPAGDGDAPVAPVAPAPEVNLPVAEDPAPVDPAPVDPAPVDPAPVDPAPVDPAPVDPAPVDHDPTPAPPGTGQDDGGAPPAPGSHDGQDGDVPVAPVDDHNATSGDPVPVMGDHPDVPTVPDATHHDPISLPVDDAPASLPVAVTDAIAPNADLHAVTASLTSALGAAPVAVPDFHLTAPTPTDATVLVPDSPELPPMQVTDVDHAAGTVTATPMGAPGMPSMTLPLDQVQAAHDASGSSAVSFATGAFGGALTSLTVVGLAARKLRKA